MNSGLSIETNKIVTFLIGDDIFGIDIMAVREIIRLENIRELPDAPDYFYGLINMRGEIIPAINFKKIFGFTGFDFQTGKDVIICKVENKVFGLVIDKVIKVADYDKKDIGPAPKFTTRIQAAIITGVIKIENELISIIDIITLFSEKGQNFLSYDTFRKEIFQSSLVEHYFTKKDLDKLISLFNAINFPFNEITRKYVLEYIVKSSARKNIKIEDVIENIKNKNNAIVPEYLFHKNKDNIVFFRDNDFLVLQKILLQVILPNKRRNNENFFKFWVINENSLSEDAFSLLFILAVLFEDEFDVNWEIISSGNNIDGLNIAQKCIFKNENLKRVTNTIKKYLLTNIENENKNIEIDNNTYYLKNEWKNKIYFDLFFIESKIKKEKVDIIYAPDIICRLSDDMQKHVLNRFYESLNPGGVLLCGFFENITNIKSKFKTYMICNRAYQIKE